MKRTIIVLVLFVVFTYDSQSQSLENLYYAQPVGLGNNPLIMPIYGDNGMLLFDVGQKEIYSLRKGNYFTDTLRFAQKTSEQILSMFWVGDQRVSVNSYNKGCIYQLEKGIFIEKYCLDYNRGFRKNLKKEYQIRDNSLVIKLIDEGEIIIETGSQIVYVHEDKTAVSEKKDELLIESSQRNRIFGNNGVNVTPGEIFIWDQFRNRLTIFSRQQVQSKTLSPLEVISPDGVNHFYYDRATQRKYLWRWNVDQKEGEMFDWALSSNEFTKIESIYTGIVKGVYQSRYYVTADFEDTIGHFFIDPGGKDKKLDLLPGLEIKN